MIQHAAWLHRCVSPSLRDAGAILAARGVVIGCGSIRERGVRFGRQVAIRVVYDRKTLPPNLHGLKGPELFGGVHMSRELLAAWRTGKVERVRWIVKDNIGLPDWAHGGDVPAAEVPFRMTNADAQIVAVRQEIVLLVGQGDLVFKLVEHWGFPQAVLPQEASKNGNGTL